MIILNITVHLIGLDTLPTYSERAKLSFEQKTPCRGNTIDCDKVILLTGAAGFIGSNFLEYMFNKYPAYHFLVLDNLTYAGNLDNISDKIKNSQRFEFYYGSITNQRLVSHLVKKAHFIVHFAAESHVSKSIYDPEIFFTTDVIGTHILMDALVEAETVERFIHISTSEVCGTAESIPMDESHPINPRSPYAGAKAAADRLVYSYQCTYDIPTVILRPFNNYGPRQHPEKMIPRFITSLLENKYVTIHGTGLQSRDWLHVTDTCNAIDRCLHLPNFDLIKNQLIHLGSGKATSVLDIATKILQNFDKLDSDIVYLHDRPGQVFCHISSTEKSAAILGWKPLISFDQGLQSTIEWYKNNKEWWQKRTFLQYTPIHFTNEKVELH